jgi:type IV pilus assembly protein PilA
MKRRKQSGFSLIELLIVVAVILIIAAIAIPNLLKAKQASNETGAAANLKTMHTGLVGYSEQCHSVGFPATLVAAGPGDGSCTGGSQHLDATLGVAAPAKQGYNYTYAPGAAAPNGAVDSYTLNADPWSANAARKHFFIDATGVIHYSDTAPATAADPALGK